MTDSGGEVSKLEAWAHADSLLAHVGRGPTPWGVDPYGASVTLEWSDGTSQTIEMDDEPAYRREWMKAPIPPPTPKDLPKVARPRR
jgi:hypothetical protein